MRQHHPAFAHSTPGGPSAAALLGTAALSTTADSGGGRAGHPRDERLVNTVSQTSRSTAWKHTGTTDLKFKAFHPQAMEVDGDEVGEGHIHHPGGIDVDEEFIWVPVAEHRPDSRAIVYRIDRDTLEVTEVFRVDDHVGGIVHDRDRHRLVGQSWGSRRFYEWSTDGRLRDKRMNDSHFIDYQDCEPVRRSKMLCSGVTDLPQAPGHSGQYELGGPGRLRRGRRHADPALRGGRRAAEVRGRARQICWSRTLTRSAKAGQPARSRACGRSMSTGSPRHGACST